MPQPETTFIRWIETQSPLWVIYALVIVAMVMIGKMLIKWLPTLFEKHCLMLETATDSMAKSATAIQAVNVKVDDNMEVLIEGHKAIAQAAVPACKAILAITPVDRQNDVREHLQEVVRILERNGHGNN